MEWVDERKRAKEELESYIFRALPLPRHVNEPRYAYLV